MLDQNGDGTLSMVEMEAAFPVLGIPVKTADVRRLVDAADTNKDGKIDYSEFMAFVEQFGQEKAATTEEEKEEGEMVEANDSFEEDNN